MNENSRDWFDWHGWKLSQTGMYLKAGDNEIVLNPTDLLVAIDETGNEDISDPNYPIFGLGGCAVLVGQYRELIVAPWMRMKRTYFGGPDVPLHAADLRNPTQEQATAIAAVFEQNPFFRFAALLTAETNIDSPDQRYLSASLMLLRFLTKIGEAAPFRRAVIVFEASDRADSLAHKTFNNLQMRGMEGDEEYDIRFDMLRGTKGLCDPALELADFVIHTAGGGVRKSLRGERMLDRLDFKAVFDSFPEPISWFFCINSVHGSPPRLGAGTAGGSESSAPVAPG